MPDFLSAIWEWPLQNNLCLMLILLGYLLEQAIPRQSSWELIHLQLSAVSLRFHSPPPPLFFLGS